MVMSGFGRRQRVDVDDVVRERAYSRVKAKGNKVKVLELVNVTFIERRKGRLVRFRTGRGCRTSFSLSAHTSTS
jgi:hypothetical protein